METALVTVSNGNVILITGGSSGCGDFKFDFLIFFLHGLGVGPDVLRFFLDGLGVFPVLARSWCLLTDSAFEFLCFFF